MLAPLACTIVSTIVSVQPDFGPIASLPADIAIARLAEEHAGRLYQVALRFCGHADEAEDLVQEVFLSAFRSWDGFRGESDPRTWLYRIAARACQRMHRRRAGEPDHIGSLDSLLPFGEPLIASVPDDQPEAIQTQIRAEAQQRLEAAIARLPDDFRIPLILKEIVGFSVRDIADILGMEQATVRSRVHRARLKLRDAIDGAIPRSAEPAPPPAYDRQTCLDLLNAKQDALDRGVAFPESVICDRCRSVFASLDLAQDLCRGLGSSQNGPEQAELLGRIKDAVRAAGAS